MGGTFVRGISHAICLYVHPQARSIFTQMSTFVRTSMIALIIIYIIYYSVCQSLVI
jgi:hypothetical protein